MRQRSISILVLAASLLCLSQNWAHTQPTGIPEEIGKKLAELGPVINPPETAKLYAPLQEKEPYQGLKVTRDLKYGADERHALDVFAPETAGSTPRPVLIFVHGGGFTGGNKRGPDSSPFYDNIAIFAARNSMVGVNMTYRLAPHHKWPAGAEDVGAAVRWVGENIAAYGGDPNRVFLMGHSAGAVHAASYVTHTRFHGPKGIGLLGAIFISGLYDFTKLQPSPPDRAYLGDGEERRTEASTLALLPAARVRLMAVYGDLDPPNFIEQGKLLNDALCKANRCSSLLRLPGHSHMSEVYAINTPDKSLSDRIVTFVTGGR
jgi:triacylglycerol lipase